MTTNSKVKAKACINCEYYFALTTIADRGECRVHSPTIEKDVTTKTAADGVFPRVRPDDWCGEFKATTSRKNVEEIPLIE